MDARPRAKLIFLCGKMAAGKSTLAKTLAEREDAVLLVEDEFLDRLYPGEIREIADYVRCSWRIRAALGPHIGELVSKGISVVLDFAANTRRQRAWCRELIDATNAGHELHFIDASDEVCKRQLRERSREMPAGSAWTTDAEFDAITAYFEPPSADEHFTVVRHEPQR